MLIRTKMNYFPFDSTSSIYDAMQVNPYAPGLQNLAAKPCNAYPMFSSGIGMKNAMGIPAISALYNDPTSRFAVNVFENIIKNDWVSEEQIKQIGSKLLEPRNVEHLVSMTMPVHQDVSRAIAMDRCKDIMMNGLLNHVIDERRARRKYGIQELKDMLSTQDRTIGGIWASTGKIGSLTYPATGIGYSGVCNCNCNI